jgi:hypothetical protein
MLCLPYSGEMSASDVALASPGLSRSRARRLTDSVQRLCRSRLFMLFTVVAYVALCLAAGLDPARNPVALSIGPLVIGSALVADRRIDIRTWILWAMVVIGFLGLLGSTIAIGGVLLVHWDWGLGPVRYDRLLHLVRSGVALALIHNIWSRRRSYLGWVGLLATGAVGLGVGFEFFEMLSALALRGRWVPDTVGIAWDLVFDVIGVAVAMAAVLRASAIREQIT